MIGDFYFHPREPEPPQPKAADAAAPAPVAAVDVELTYWNSIQNSANPAVFKSYLQRYPSGHFADLANIKLAELTVDPTPAPPWTQPKAPRTKAPAPAVRTPENKAGPPVTAPVLEKTKPVEFDSLPVVAGDRGVQTRIARNDEELAVLMRSDPRSIERVSIPESEDYVGVGGRGAQVLVKKTDANKQRYTLTLQEPERRGAGANPSGRPPSLNPDAKISLLDGLAEQVEKKNLQTLEPIQYNMQGPNVCDELVIYRVEPGRIVGYLAEAKP